MADRTNAKAANSSAYPVKAIDASSFQRVEPFLTPKLFLSRFLKGIPLKSPITKEEYSKEELQDYIQQSMNLVEMESQLDIAPVQRRHRLPFHRDQYQEFIFIEIPNKPILSVDELGIRTSNDTNIYTFPQEWIDPANFIDGKINVIPLSPAIAGNVNGFQSPSAGGGFLVMIGLSEHIPAYWEVKCTTGFTLKTGVPMILNRLIGLKTACMVLTNLINQFQYSSFSLGIDGVSQSQTTQAPQLYQNTRDQYEKEYADLMSQIMMRYNNKIIMSVI